MMKRSDDVCQYLPTILSLFTAHKNIWKEVLDMEESIHINYDTMEQLFSKQQPVVVKPVDQKKSKQNTEVYYSLYYTLAVY